MTVTIVEFLTARLDEREDWCTPKAGERSHWIGPHDSECDALVRDGYGDRGELPCSCGEPARVLADTAAKRRIVRLASINADQEWHTGYTCGAELGYDVILSVLASAYTDHPDYREEWKP